MHRKQYSCMNFAKVTAEDHRTRHTCTRDIQSQYGDTNRSCLHHQTIYTVTVCQSEGHRLPGYKGRELSHLTQSDLDCLKHIVVGMPAVKARISEGLHSGLYMTLRTCV